jgi:hypothetical protein
MTNFNSSGKKAKRRNHTVPKSLLKRWHDPTAGGLHYIDCTSGIVEFELGIDANFAISPYQYVPIRAGYRDEDLEDWFSGDENFLALLSGSSQRRRHEVLEPHNVGKAVRAVLSLAYRSSYEYGLTQKLIAKLNPGLSEEEVMRMVVDQYKEVYFTNSKILTEFDYTIFYDLSDELLICDRPAFDMRVRGDEFQMFHMPLGPNAALIAMPKADAKPVVKKVSGANKSSIVSMLNHQTVERARQFVVGTSDSLNNHLAELAPQKVQQRATKDQLIMIKV